MIEDDPRPNREEAVETICAMGFDVAKPDGEFTVKQLVRCGTLGSGKPRMCRIDRLPIGFSGPPPKKTPGTQEPKK